MHKKTLQVNSNSDLRDLIRPAENRSFVLTRLMCLFPEDTDVLGLFNRMKMWPTT